MKVDSLFEFVICSGFPDANDLMKSVVLQNGGIIIWCSSIPVDGDREILELLVPGNENVKISMMHKDKNLNKYLHNVKTSRECKDFFIDSHEFAKLLIVNAVDKTNKHGIFTFDDLFNLVKDTLDYLNDETIRKETEDILSLARDGLGFVQELQDQPGSYRITLKSKKADSRERELRDKWIDYKIEQGKEKEKHEGLIKIRQEFRNKRSLQRNIDDFA